MDKLKIALPSLVLIWVNLQTLHRIDDLEQSFVNMRHLINETSNQVSGIKYIIQKDLDEDNILDSFDYSLFESLGELCDIHVNIALNELSKDSKVYLTYKEVAPKIYYSNMEVIYENAPSNETHRILLTYVDDLDFTGSFKIDKRFTYEMKLVIESDEIMKSLPLDDLDLYHDYYPQIDIDIRPYEMTSDGLVHYSCALDIYNPTDINVLSATSSIVYNGKKYDTFDLMEIAEAETYEEDEPIAFYELDRSYNFNLGENVALKFDDITLVMIVETDAGLTFKYTWSE